MVTTKRKVIKKRRVILISKIDGIYYKNRNASNKKIVKTYDELLLKYGAPDITQCKYSSKPCEYASWKKGRIRVEMLYKHNLKCNNNYTMVLYIYHDSVTELLNRYGKLYIVDESCAK